MTPKSKNSRPVEQLVLNIVAHPPRQPRPKAPKAAAAAPAKKRNKVTADIVAMAGQPVGRRSSKPLPSDRQAFFKAALPAPGVIPQGSKIAQDSNFNPGLMSWAGEGMGSVGFSEGYTFLGYPYLSQLAQIPEYRLISETISREATRKWIKIKSRKDEDAKASDPDAPEEKAEQVRAIEEEFERLKVQERFRTVSLQDGFFGRAHLYIDTGDDGDELQKPMGNGDRFTKQKFNKKGFLKALKVVEPVWTYPMNYNASNPLADDWYKPEVWYVMGQGVHVSRILPFISKPVPDLLKPAFSFGGLSLSQMAKPYVDNWLETRQSVNDIIQAFSIMVLKTDLETLLAGGGEELFNRADLFNRLRNNRGLMMVNKETEDFGNVSAPLGTLDKLQAQAQEHICSVSQIPLVKYTGISPTGLNASSEGELECFDDTIHAYQEAFFDEHLRTVFRLAQLNIWGKVDDDLFYEFVPLGELSEKEIADLQKTRSDTHKNYIDAGVVDPVEVRSSVKNDPHTLYPDIDPEEVPEPRLEPENIHEAEGEGGSGETGGEKKPERAQDAAAPENVGDQIAKAISAMPPPNINITAHIEPAEKGDEVLTVTRDGAGRITGARKGKK